jgi:carboxypeptidase family protein/TonB-dependent receptor-like protein
MSRRLVQVALVALCLTVFALPSSAQVFTGRIDVVVKDGTGAVLPGVTVELTGVQTQRAVTDAQGGARFLNLAPGKYELVAKLSGFNDYKNDNVPVGAGSIVELPVVLTVGAVTEKVNVTADTPVIETKKQTVSTNVSLDELQNIPSSRDPWVVLQTVPGIIVDRVNVGGAESGQQSNYQAKGAAGTDNTWSMDGIAITDMAALGSSPTYYDFDMFQEMQVTTGGADPSNPTPGVQLNFVLRSGTNRWRASARYYYENNDLQSDNVGSAIVGQLQSYNRAEFYKDYGAEGGGPIIKDKLFIWGAYGKTNPAMEIYTYRTNDNNVFRTGPGCKGDALPYASEANTYQITARDCTILENVSAKATYNLAQNWRASFTYFRGNKSKFGRGASATHPAPTTWNQAGPTDMFKGEVNYTMSNNTFLAARYAYTGGGFSLEPVGGRGVQSFLDDDGVWGGSYLFYVTDRPQNNFQIEGNHFRTNHEFKFGFGYRKASVASQSGFPGGVLNIHSGYPDVLAQFTRDANTKANGVYWSAYLGDQWSKDRLTMNLGLRWDRQIANLEASTVPSVPFDFAPVKAILGDLTGPAQEAVTVWNSITPRIGLTYALNESRKTIARASYAMFASQLLATRGTTVSQIPATNTGSGYVYWLARDVNGDKQLQANELIGNTPVDTVGFDPTDPLGGNADRIGNYKVPMTHEVLLGVEHELYKNFGVSGNVTWRKLTNFNWLQFDGVDGNDYTQTGTLSGSVVPVGPYNVPLYSVNPSAVPADRGRLFEVRDGYSQKYWGIELAATKRLADRWMARVGWSTNNHREYFDSLDAVADPTPTVPQASAPLQGPNKDGGLVVTQTSGSGKGNIYLVLPKYQFILTGAYQAKWDINVGLNYVMRQGYATPFYRSQAPGSADDLNGAGKSVLLIPDAGDYRLPNVHSIDFRVNKAIRIKNFTTNFDVDVFNLFNQATTLAKQIDLRLGSFNAVREIMNPRIIRVGIRVGF